MKNVLYFQPNSVNDPVFASALKEAKNAGVKIIAVDCEVTDKEMIIKDFVEVKI
jgi:sugar fermentation stimulation protein A